MNLAKAANQLREFHHPKNPVTLDFELDEDYLPEGFFCKDIRFGDQHHIIFASGKMIELLFHSKNWFIDTTFNVVKEPFKHFRSIHAFV